MARRGSAAWPYLWRAVCCGLGWAAVGLFAHGADRGQFSMKTVVAGLDAPWGVAVNPRTGHVYVSEAAAGRVRRIDPARPQLAGDVITDFDRVDPIDHFPFGASLDLACLNHRTLLVADARCRGKWAEMSAYEIPDAGSPVAADKASVWIVPRGTEVQHDSDETNALLHRLIVVNDRTFIASAGRDSAGRIDRILWQQGKPGELKSWRTEGRAETIGPIAIGVNQRGYLVAASMGSVDRNGGAGQLRFHAPTDGHAVLDLPVDLPTIIDLAYRQQEGMTRLYALDLGWNAPAGGGLYRIDAGRPGEDGPAVRAVRILRLERPTAMAFAADGRLFITTAGRPDASGSARQGKLLVVTGDL